MPARNVRRLRRFDKKPIAATTDRRIAQQPGRALVAALRCRRGSDRRKSRLAGGRAGRNETDGAAQPFDLRIRVDFPLKNFFCRNRA